MASLARGAGAQQRRAAQLGVLLGQPHAALRPAAPLQRTFASQPLLRLHDEPLLGPLRPVRVAVDEGATYRWCACGRSSTQPWCDGAAHKATSIRPVVFVAPKTGLVSLCGCKATRSRRPYCDGSHNHLGGGVQAAAAVDAVPGSKPAG